MPTAVPAIPGIAPIAAAMMGMRAGKIPPFSCFPRRRVLPPLTPFLLLLVEHAIPAPETGTAVAVVPVVMSLAVAGAPLCAAARAASEAAGAG